MPNIFSKKNFKKGMIAAGGIAHALILHSLYSKRIKEIDCEIDALMKERLKVVKFKEEIAQRYSSIINKRNSEDE